MFVFCSESNGNSFNRPPEGRRPQEDFCSKMCSPYREHQVGSM